MIERKKVGAGPHRGEQPDTQTQALRQAATVILQARSLTVAEFAKFLPKKIGAASDASGRTRRRRKVAWDILQALCDDGRAEVSGRVYVAGPAARAEAA